MQHIHLIGIGGSGLSAIARVLLESGYPVSGSDRQISPQAEALRAAGVRVYIGHRAEQVSGADLVVRSSAVPDDNPEVLAAQAQGIPVLKRAEFLGQLLEQRQVLAVAGTHGKTTTTAMMAWTLSALGTDPSFIAGGVLANLGVNAHAGHGSQFVIEADEYDRMFLGLRPKVAVVTNLEHDHPDCYPELADYYAAFRQFTHQIEARGVLIACGDDPGAVRLLAEAQAEGQNGLSYGLKPGNHYTAQALSPAPGGGYHFTLVGPPSSQPLAQVRLQVPGEHNVRNALAVLAAVDWLELSLIAAAEALSLFRGAGRRFDVRGEAGGVLVVDDYAHHPTEIQATLSAARTRYPERPLWVVWQPHTYSRLQTLWERFLGAFEAADHLLVTDVYAAREQAPAGGPTARRFVDEINHPDARFAGDLESARQTLLAEMQPGNVLLVLSAGDADRLSANVFDDLSSADRAAARKE